MYRMESPKVLYSTEQIAKVSLQDARMLTQILDQNPDFDSVRLCTHKNIEASLHQMFIVHPRGAYIRPHRHKDREMTITMFQGKMKVLVFSDSGEIEEVVQMGDFLSGETFYCFIPAGKFYSQIIESDQAFFNEILLGPFSRSNVIYADFAPMQDAPEADAYLKMLVEKTQEWHADSRMED